MEPFANLVSKSTRVLWASSLLMFLSLTAQADYTPPAGYVSPLPADLTHGDLRVYNHSDHPTTLEDYELVNTGYLDSAHAAYYDYWEFYYFAGDADTAAPLTASRDQHDWDSDLPASCQLVMRVYRPAGWTASSGKVAMNIHGGGWLAGSSRSVAPYIDTDLYSGGVLNTSFSVPGDLAELYGDDRVFLVTQLLDKGYLVYSPTYRGHGDDTSGGDADCSGANGANEWAVWQGAIRDTQQAFYHVVNSLPAFFASASINEKIIDVIGNSAGAHLATVLATHGIGNTSSTYSWELAHGLETTPTADPLIAGGKDGRFMIRSVVAIGPPVDFSLISGVNCNVDEEDEFDGTSTLVADRQFHLADDMEDIKTYSASSSQYISLTPLLTAPHSASYTTNTSDADGNLVSVLGAFLSNASMDSGYSSLCEPEADIYTLSTTNDFFIYNTLANFYDPEDPDSPRLKLIAGSADTLVPPDMSIAFCENIASKYAAPVKYLGQSPIGVYNNTSSYLGEDLNVDRFACGAASKVTLEIMEGNAHMYWDPRVSVDPELLRTGLALPIWAWLRPFGSNDAWQQQLDDGYISPVDGAIPAADFPQHGYEYFRLYFSSDDALVAYPAHEDGEEGGHAESAIPECELVVDVYKPINWSGKKAIIEFPPGGWVDGSVGGYGHHGGDYPLSPPLDYQHGQRLLTAGRAWIDNDMLGFVVSWRTPGSHKTCQESGTDPTTWKEVIHDLQEAFYHITLTIPSFMTKWYEYPELYLVGTSAGGHMANMIAVHGVDRLTIPEWNMNPALAPVGRDIITRVATGNGPVDFAKFKIECEAYNTYDPEDIDPVTNLRAQRELGIVPTPQHGETSVPIDETSEVVTLSLEVLDTFYDGESYAYDMPCDTDSKFMQGGSGVEEFTDYNQLGAWYHPDYSPEIKLAQGAGDGLVVPEMAIGMCDEIANIPPLSGMTFVDSLSWDDDLNASNPRYTERFLCGSSKVQMELVRDAGHFFEGAGYMQTTSVAGVENYVRTMTEWLEGDLFDEDADGMGDGWEVTYGLDPSVDDADDDADGDGLTNLDEHESFTDPSVSDSDGDGMPDGWEITYSLDPLVNDADADADEDGYSNLQEYRGGTDPLDEMDHRVPSIKDDYDDDGIAGWIWQGPGDTQSEVWQLTFPLGTNNWSDPDITVLSEFSDQANWNIATTGDFDGDGDADILWRHDVDSVLGGEIKIWEMEDGTDIDVIDIGTADTDHEWTIVGAGDTDKDGDDDLLFANNSTGEVIIAEMQDGDMVYLYSLGIAADENDDVTHLAIRTGDFDQDDDVDLLLQEVGSTALITWEIENNGFVLERTLANTGTDYNPVCTGDFDGDGDDDIMLVGASPTNQEKWFEMEDFVRVQHFSSANEGFTFLGCGDYDGDGDADSAWRADTDGKTRVVLQEDWGTSKQTAHTDGADGFEFRDNRN